MDIDKLVLSNTRVLSGASFIFYLPVKDVIAYSVDDHHVQLASGEVVLRFDVVMLKIQRVEEFVKLLLNRSLRPPRPLTTTEYAARNNIDQQTAQRFCRSALGPLYGAFCFGTMRASWRIPEDVPLPIVLMSRLSRRQQGVATRDLVIAALHSGHGNRGITIADLALRLETRVGTVRQAVYELKKENIVTAAGRGKVKLVRE
jgi:hypothetical protein